MPFTLRQRSSALERLGQEVFDLVIIGGGINGAGIARDAALRHYSVLLLDQEDFGFGTSSRSSRLIHGGLRYLEHGLVRLVFESVSERARLARIARHLVRPLPFIFPLYQGDVRLITMDMGLWIYDALALFRNYRTHEELTPLAIAEAMPGIRQASMQGGVHYYDYQTDDGRLVLENVLSAVDAGSAALSYCKVEGCERSGGRVVALQVTDRLTGASHTARGRAFICAAGPWTDRLLSLIGEPQRWLRPTKGVHLVIPRERLPLDAALAMRHPRDGRVLFTLPYHERTVIGTTDTDFTEDPGEVGTTAEDVLYLFEVARHYFPGIQLSAADVVSTWAGVRPLLDPGEEKDPGAVSREHRIEVRPDGVIVVAGGKLTTYRRMAFECVEAAVGTIAANGGPPRQRHAPTQRLPLPGSEGLRTDEDVEALAERVGQALGDQGIGRHLAYLYGGRSVRIAALAASDAALRERITDELPYIWAEIVFTAREEMAVTLADAFIRRTHLFYRAADQGLARAERGAALMGGVLGWDAAEQARQAGAYAAQVAANRSWRAEMPED